MMAILKLLAALFLFAGILTGCVDIANGDIAGSLSPASTSGSIGLLDLQPYSGKH